MRASLHKFGDARSMTGVQIQGGERSEPSYRFLRPEDGAWVIREPMKQDRMWMTEFNDLLLEAIA